MLLTSVGGSTIQLSEARRANKAGENIKSSSSSSGYHSMLIDILQLQVAAVAAVAEDKGITGFGGARDIRPVPVGTEPFPCVGVLPPDGAGVVPRNTEPVRGRCSGVPLSLAVPRSIEACRDPKPPLKRLAARAYRSIDESRLGGRLTVGLKSGANSRAICTAISQSIRACSAAISALWALALAVAVREIAISERCIAIFKARCAEATEAVIRSRNLRDRAINKPSVRSATPKPQRLSFFHSPIYVSTTVGSSCSSSMVKLALDSLFRLAGALSERAVRTNPPRISSVRALFFAALAAFSLLRNELNEACMSLRRWWEARPKGADVRIP
uniref:Uncharacterized protein n=1 Tax=Glossina pallidipes TaxID=7398 RepID=A0A1B0A4W6_GLOPL